jgi:hypothetical protein
MVEIRAVHVTMLDSLMLVPVRVAIGGCEPLMLVGMVTIVMPVAVNVREGFVDVEVVVAIDQQEGNRWN